MLCRESQIVRLERLERFVRVTKCLFVLSLAIVAGRFIFGRYVSASTPDGEILRVRGIVIEDSAGRPRLLLGAPISNHGRKRQDEVTGLVMLNEDGIDRLALGTANYDQINGTLQHRVSNGIGVLLNDAQGNERGGFGFLDSGRVTLGLDRAHGEEGAFLTVDDEDDFAGLRVKDLGTCITASLGNSRTGGTRLLVRDEACKDRVSLEITGATPKLEVRDSEEKLVFDAFAKPNK
jgi:hypothetical protein